MRRVIDLREEEVGRFPHDEFRDNEILALIASAKVEVEPASILNGYTYGIRSRGWIGQIPVSDALLLRVTPKVGVSSVFRMLEIAYNLRSFQLFEGEINIESLAEVYERIVSILARRVLDRTRRGLYRGYIEAADELPYLRGRMNALGAVLNRSRGVPRMPCHYQEHTADLDDNRILFWALQRVPRQGLRHEKVRTQLDWARRALTGTITLEGRSAADCIGRVYNRLNDDYRPMHGLCRFILEHAGPGITGGDRSFIPFELRMPQLFEMFVAEWLRSHAPRGMSVRPQYNTRIHANFEMEIRVDLVLYDERSQPIAVLDTKYKTSEQPSEADIYQIAFYARELGVNHAILIYPSKTTKPLRMRHGNDISLDSLVFDISHTPEIAGPDFLRALHACLSGARHFTEWDVREKSA